MSPENVVKPLSRREQIRAAIAAETVPGAVWCDATLGRYIGAGLAARVAGHWPIKLVTDSLCPSCGRYGCACGGKEDQS